MDEGSLSVGWLVAAIAAHGALLGPGYLRDESGAILCEMRAAIRAQLDPFEMPIEAPPPPKEPEPVPEPPEQPPPRPTAMQTPRPLPKAPDDLPPNEAPETPEPTPMEAQAVLVQDADALDPSAATFVTGNGLGTGLVSAFGTGYRPARWWPGGGGGHAPPPPPPPEPDRSRAASLHGDRAWDCDFPSEAEAAGIRNALVALRILVRADGRAQRVEVVSDPGHGFGAQAQYCAERHLYLPALDRTGKPIQASLGPVRIRFTR